MLSIAYIFLFLTGGMLITRWQLPRLRMPVRVYIGLCFGWLLYMWLPALWAYAVSFSAAGHLLALATLALAGLGAFVFRDRRPARRMDAEDKKALWVLAACLIPLTFLGVALEYTHTLRPAANGTYHVGQSTYGDLQLHLAIASSAVNARFPLHNSLLLGATMAYPYLSDTVASSMVLMGMPLNAAMVITGGMMLFLVFAGYGLLAYQLCRKKGAAVLALLLLFLNGGLGFFYVLDARIENGVTTTLWDNLKTVMEGYYKTPTNQPTPYNLRWVNIICDMLIPQRGILGGWTLLMPALNLLLPPLCRRTEGYGLTLPEDVSPERGLRPWILLALFAGGLPLAHTHSYLSLVLLSAGCGTWCLCHTPKDRFVRTMIPWLLYAGIAALLSVPQLVCFTFRQTSSSNHFLRLWFNWVNNSTGKIIGAKFIDNYFWFYIKNVGVPYVLILLALLQRRPKGDLRGSDEDRAVSQNRMLACGAFLIYAAAEFIQFQPNIYDNNKLLYVWFLLCLPMASDYVCILWEKLTGVPGRRALAVVFTVLCFTSSALTIARECVSDYEVYNSQDIATAGFIRENIPEHSLFLTGTQHINPVSSLAGQDIYCGPDLYLYFHGFSTGEMQANLWAFYEDPLDNLDLLRDNGIEYVYVSAWERSSYEVDEEAIESLFPMVYESAGGYNRIFQVPEEYRR